MVDIFEEWAVTVHRCQPNVQAKRDVHWNLIRRHREIAIQVLEFDIYSKGNEHSYIRLNPHSRRSDLAQRYLIEKQKTGERTTEFVSRLTALRNKAFGKKNAQGLWDYKNAWIHHLEVVLKGFENKQIMAKVNDVNPQTPGKLYDSTCHAEETLNHNLRFGYVQGAVDSKALVGLNLPGQNVSQLSQTGVQALGGPRPTCFNHRCGKCGARQNVTAPLTSGARKQAIR